MDRRIKTPSAKVPINRIWTSVIHPNGEPLDIAITQYPYRTHISILRINLLNNERSNRSIHEP